MKYLKVYSLLFSLFLFSACSEFVSIIEATKTMNISGLSRGKNHIDYNLTINVKKKITFESITLNNEEIKESLFLKDLNTGLSSTKIKKNIKEGKYEFGFRFFNTKNFKEKQTIIFTYKIKDKLFTQKKEVIIKKTKVNK